MSQELPPDTGKSDGIVAILPSLSKVSILFSLLFSATQTPTNATESGLFNIEYMNKAYAEMHLEDTMCDCKHTHIPTDPAGRTNC